MKKHNPAFVALVDKVKKEIQEVDLDTVHQWLNQSHPFILVDVREGNEWRQGHLPQAIHLSKGVIERDIEQTIPDKATNIVLYCGGGFRSALAASNLQQMGYQNVFSMQDGFRGWRKAKLPVVQSEKDD